MKVSLDRVPFVVACIRWGIVAVAGVLLLVFDYVNTALLLLVLGLIFGFALRRVRFRIWLVSKLTGLDAEMLRAAHEEHTRPAPPPMPPKAQPARPGLTRDNSRYFWQHPEPMDDETMARLIDETQEPAIRLIRHLPGNPPEGVNSWLGGVPNLPHGMDWPRNPRTGFALHHLAQIDLGEMPLPADAPLPVKGMLWFFADISEDMDWGEGPNAATCVLHHPLSTKGNALAAVPDDLPQIDHADTKMTATRFSFRGPLRAVYPRWPLHGAACLATPFNDTPPKGVTDPKAFYDALGDIEKAQRLKLTGPKFERDHNAHPIIERYKEPVTREDGSTGAARRTRYHPQQSGGHFPYTNRLGWHVLNWAHHFGVTAYESEASRIHFAQKRGEDVPRSRVKTHDDAVALAQNIENSAII